MHELLAQEAFHYVINRYNRADGFQSGNKWNFTASDQIEEAGRIISTGIITGIIKERVTYETTIALLNAFNCGNCYELSLLCYDYITKRGGNAKLVYIPAVHNFTICGEIPARLDITNIDAWPNTFQILDPWLNILCKPREYYTSLENALQQLDTSVKIWYNGKYISPCDPQWINALKDNAKMICY